MLESVVLYSGHFSTKCDIALHCSFYLSEATSILSIAPLNVKRVLARKSIFQKWVFMKHENWGALSKDKKTSNSVFCGVASEQQGDI